MRVLTARPKRHSRLRYTGYSWIRVMRQESERDRRARSAMYSVAVAVVAAVLVPVSAPSTNIGGAQPLTVRKSESIGVSPWMAPPVLVSRDPFVPGNRWAEDPAPRVVPNAVRAITAPTVLVKAIVIGPHPLA